MTDTATRDATRDAYAAAALQTSDERERVGLEVLAAHPSTLSTLVTLAERAAARRADFGDVSAEAVSTAVAMLAHHAGAEGLPDNVDERAHLVALTAKRAAERARDAARRAWSPRGKRDQSAPLAHNALPRWSNVALIRRAEQYTNGTLEHNASPVPSAPVPGQISPRLEPIGTGAVRGGAVVTAPAGTGAYRFVVNSAGETTYGRDAVRPSHPRVLAGAVLEGRRDELTGATAYGKVPRAPRVPRHAGGTSPAAERVYWSNRHADTLATALECAFALTGIDRDALTDPAVWSRRGGMHWQALAANLGRDRGTVRREVRRAAARARAVAANVADDPR